MIQILFLWFLLRQALADLSHQGQVCRRIGRLFSEQPQTGPLKLLAQIANGALNRIVAGNIDNSRDSVTIFCEQVEVLNYLAEGRRLRCFQDDGHSFGPAKIVGLEPSIALMSQFGSRRWVEMSQANIRAFLHCAKS